MRVLVTGGTGFIGSELLSILQNTAHDVYSLERHHGNTSNHNENRRYKIEEADITKAYEVTQLVEKIEPEVLVHLAAQSHVASSYDNPIEYIATNLVGTINLAQACIKLKNFKRMIFASSLDVYKDTPNVLQTEDKTPEEPNSPYGITKLASEKYLLSLFRNHKFPVFILRLANIYGRKRRPFSIVEKLITQMLEGRNEIDLGSPEPTRDFLYVSDAVNACMQLMGSKNIDEGKILNISTSTPTSIKELADIVITQTRFKNQINWNSGSIPSRPGDPKWLVAGNTKAKKILNWEPKISLDEGIQKTIAIYRP
jgi:UDP-glucose 4-epimerase